MNWREYRLGGGLNYRNSPDVIDDAELLQCLSWVFTEPGCIQVEVPPTLLTNALLSGTLTNDHWDGVQGIADVIIKVEGDEIHKIITKNDHAWQQMDYDGTDIVAINPGQISSVLLAAGDNVVTYEENPQYFRAPSSGVVVLKVWGAGGGGGTGPGLGSGNGGGAGGLTTCTFNVAADDFFKVYVGQGGTGGKHLNTLAAGGYPDGGDAAIYSGTGASSGYQAGGGGGSSRVYYNDVLVAVAGGGGGARLEGGSGGGTTGGNDSNSGGTGGTQSAGGVDTSDPTDDFKWGGSFQGGTGGHDNLADAGGGGGGGYFGGGGGGGANFGTVRGGGGGSGYLSGLGTSESFTTNPTGTQNPAPASGNSSYSASAGRRAGNPDTDTACGGLTDVTSSSNDGNDGGNGMVVIAFTSGAGTGDIPQPSVTGGRHQLSAVRFGLWTYISDGYNFRRYKYDDDLNAYLCQLVGVQAPAAPTFVSNANPGASVDGVTYRWAYTFWNGVAESNMSPALVYTSDADNRAVIIGIGTDPDPLSGTIWRKIYRSNANGTAMFHVDEVQDNTTTTFEDPIAISTWAGDPAAQPNDEPSLNSNPLSQNGFPIPEGIPYDKDALDRGDIKVSNLGLLADWTNHDRAPTDTEGTVRNLRVLDDVLYGITQNSYLAFTTLGNPEYWSPFNAVIIGRATGERLQDIQCFGKDMICYSDRGVWRFRRFGILAEQSTLEPVSETAGACSEMAVVVTESHGHFFMSYDGIYQFDGREVKKISHGIENIWRDPDNSDYADRDSFDMVCAGRHNDKLWWAYRVGTIDQDGGNPPVDHFPNRMIHLDLTDGTLKWATSVWNHSSLHKGYDGSVFSGNQDGELNTIDRFAFTDQVIATLKTKLYQTSAALPTRGDVEEVRIDADFAGQAAGIVFYGDNFDNPIATVTIAAETGGDRQVYVRRLPIGSKYDRIAMKCIVVAAASTPRAPKIYSIGFGSLSEDAEE